MADDEDRMVGVVAPGTLEAGATFVAEVDGINYSVTVPDGGVEKGDEFEVKFSSLKRKKKKKKKKAADAAEGVDSSQKSRGIDAGEEPLTSSGTKKKKTKKKRQSVGGDDGLPVATAMAVPDGQRLLDPETYNILSNMDSFFIQQRIRFVEAVTGGCCEQANVYDVFDKNTNKRIMIMKEESDACSRCCCSPGHSLFVKFYHIGSDAPELKPGQTVDWSYDPAVSQTPFMTMEREGCDCCFSGPCPKACLCCFACTPGCSELATLHAGDVDGQPGDAKGKRERVKLLGESIQPIGGGGFKPVMQIMDRADPDDEAVGKTEMFAATRGPCLFGGCAECCFDSEFGQATASPEDFGNVSKQHQLNFGDFATITKLKPKSLSEGMREFFTDSDLYDVKFTNPSVVTPQQKANVLMHMVHLDYMFFERDNDMCYHDANGTHIVCFNCFCYGCVCPCECVLSNNAGN